MSWLQGRSLALAGGEGGGCAPLSHAGLGIMEGSCTLGSQSHSQEGGGLDPQKGGECRWTGLGYGRVLVRVRSD